MNFDQRQPCPVCMGSGHEGVFGATLPCLTCNGAGVVVITTTNHTTPDAP